MHNNSALGSLRIWPYIFFAPFLLLYAVFQLFPILWSFGLSLMEWNGINEPIFVGLRNFHRLFFKDPFFLKSIGNTLLLMGLYFPALLFGGLLLALGLYHEHLHYKRLFRIGIFLPYITTPVAIGIIFGLLFDRDIGVINSTLAAFGIGSGEINWLGEVASSRMVVSLMVSWRYVGYHAIVFLGGLSTISSELYDAAKVDGASAFRRFFAITLPGIKQVGLFLLITDIIGGFQLVEEPMLLFTGWATGTNQVGGPGRGCLTAVWHLYDTAFQRSSLLGYGSAIGYGLFMFIILFSIFGVRLSGGINDE